MTLEEDFHIAIERTKSLTQRPSNKILLKLYALYKQATTGDVEGDPPAGIDFKALAKYNAWKSLEGRSRENCMKEYISLVRSLE
jgi:acyl-CoA-binding protein